MRNAHKILRGTAALVAGLSFSSLLAEDGKHEHGHDLGLSEEFVPFEELGEGFTKRPKPVTEVLEDAVFEENRQRNEIIENRQANPGVEDGLELPERRNLFGGNPFLGTGDIFEGIETPTGAVVQPVFILWGDFRTAVQTFDNGATDITEWTNRLNVFGNLYLTPTERLLFQIRPFDQDGGFTGVEFEGPDEGGFESLNGNIRTLFFEGDIGEIFPRWDLTDTKHFDIGFSVGRQPLNFQDGIILNDFVDSIGFTRSSMFWFGSNATHVTGYLGVNELHRNLGVEDDNALIYGINVGADYDKSTYELDAVYVDGDSATGGDGVYLGAGQIRRFGHWNSTLRFNQSWSLDEETTAVSTGSLVSHQLSKTMRHNHDIFYLNSFLGIDDYASAGRDPSTGGPLGTVGILYASTGLGRFAAPLGNRVGDNLGFATGYQHFMNDNKSQLIFELGGRHAMEENEQNSLGFMTRYQRAFGLHQIFVIDAFVAGYDDPLLDDWGYGLRAEWRVKF
ncbi:MAG: hypothetical protein ACI8UO_003873 [Verrucomicrobiales bacterium]|jgi:hypothetical protein